MSNYHYTECGLDNVYLVNGFKIETAQDGEAEFVINDIHGLHMAIAKALVFKPSLLSGKEVRFIRHYLDLSQKSFGALTGVGYQSVLNWEKEKNPIAETADRLIRTLVLLYMSKDEAHNVYDRVNEISDLDALDTDETHHCSIKMEEHDDSWRMAA